MEVKMIYRHETEDRLPFEYGHRVVLVPTKCYPYDTAFVKAYFFKVAQAKRFAKKNGWTIINIDDFEYNKEIATHELAENITEYEKEHDGERPTRIVLSKAAAEAIKPAEIGDVLDVEIRVSEKDPERIWVECL